MQQNNIPFPEEKQVFYLIRTLAYFLLFTKIWNYKTWIADRFYPVIPPFGFLEKIPDEIHIILFALSILTLILMLFLKTNRLLISAFLTVELLSCSLDTARWQPWEFMYLCVFTVSVIGLKRPKNILFFVHLLLVAMYFYSGVHKLARSFLTVFWSDFILQNLLGLSMEFILKFRLFFVGLMIPLTEISLAVLLLVLKNKRRVSFFLIIMHVGILLFIGPFGLNYNAVVWFWNLAMIAVLIIIYKNPLVFPGTDILIKNFYWILLWFVMPVFSFFGMWFQYFSFNLYSAKGYQMYICLENQNSDLKQFEKNDGISLCSGKKSVNLQNWAMSEIKSAPSPEIEDYRKISDALKKKYGVKNVKIILYHMQTAKVEEL